MAGVGESGDKGVLQDVEFAAGGGGAMADCIEVAVQLEKMMVVL